MRDYDLHENYCSCGEEIGWYEKSCQKCRDRRDEYEEEDDDELFNN